MKDKTNEFFKYVREQQRIEKQKLIWLKDLVYKTNNPILIKWVENNYDPYHCGGHYVEQMILQDLHGTQQDLEQALKLLEVVKWDRS